MGQKGINHHSFMNQIGGYSNLNKVCLSLLVVLVFGELQTRTILVNAYVRGNDWKDLLLTTSEKHTLDEFKAKVIDRLPEEYMKTDYYLQRWLRARNFNIPRAQTMLMQNLNWRRENKMSEILKEDFSDLIEDFPVTLDSHDKQGRPILTVEMGYWDLRAAVVQGRLPRLLRFMDWIQEKTVHRILDAQNNGKNCTRAVVLVDAEGINVMQHLCPQCVAVFVRMTAGMESHFPGFWEEIIVVNVPNTGRIGVEAVRPVMSPQTRHILKIFNTNKKEYNSYLDERIDKNQRTLAYGGTKPNNF